MSCTAIPAVRYHRQIRTRGITVAQARAQRWESVLTAALGGTTAGVLFSPAACGLVSSGVNSGSGLVMNGLNTGTRTGVRAEEEIQGRKTQG